MKNKVYIETSIPSYYFEIRSQSEIVAQKNWTRHWWENEKDDYELVTSIAVVLELKKGNYQSKSNCLDLIKDIPVLTINEEITEIVETYIARKVMPQDPTGDALHLALASYYQCDFLLTWNCSHLANANKFHHIKIINTMMGLYVPSLVTPLQLMKEGDSYVF